MGIAAKDERSSSRFAATSLYRIKPSQKGMENDVINLTFLEADLE
jgi:hypothetical protein